MERRTWMLGLLVLLAFPASLGLRQLAPERHAPAQDSADDDSGTAQGAAAGAQGRVPCQRVVSLAPSITETLFALDLGDRVVGVSRYCTYPPEAQERPEVGGLFDPNYEAILALEPDLVVMTVEHHQHRDHLDQLGVAHLSVDHQQMGGILASFGILGEACGAGARASALEAELRAEMSHHERAATGRARPTVLMVVGREYGVGVIRDPVVAGRDGFYDELIVLAGGANAYAEGAVRFPTVSGEGLLVMDPDVIIDLVPALDDFGVDEARVKRDWDSLPGLRAVSAGQVHVLEGRHLVIPGPRFPQIIDDLAAVLHPDGEGAAP